MDRRQEKVKKPSLSTSRATTPRVTKLAEFLSSIWDLGIAKSHLEGPLGVFSLLDPVFQFVDHLGALLNADARALHFDSVCL